MVFGKKKQETEEEKKARLTKELAEIEEKERQKQTPREEVQITTETKETPKQEENHIETYLQLYRRLEEERIAILINILEKVDRIEKKIEE